MFTIEESLFSLPENLQIFSNFFQYRSHIYEWLNSLEDALFAFFEAEELTDHNEWKFRVNEIRKNKNYSIGKNVYIAENVKLPVTCTIEDNVYIDRGTEIRSGALIRKNTIIGQNCVIGSSCEIKNSLIMNNVQIAHFNYVGDSILGHKSHLGAGAVLSNFRFDGKEIKLATANGKIETGRRKLGAILGEHAQVGCNAVILPGSVICKNSIISAGVTWGGFLSKNQRLHNKNEYILKDN